MGIRDKQGGGIKDMEKSSRIERKIRRKKIGLIFILMLLISTITFVLFTRTSLFNLSDITIKGNIVLDKEKIIRASGIPIGENIFKISLKDLEKNLMEHPYIKEVKLNRRLPNKIAVFLDEREEFIVVPYIGTYVYLDNEGIVLNIYSDKKEDRLPELNGIEVKSVNIGQNIELQGKNTITHFLNIINDCRKIGIIDSVSSFVFDDSFGLTLELKSGTKVAFGDLNNVKYKLSFLLAIMEDLASNQITGGVVDLTKGDKPIFTPYGD